MSTSNEPVVTKKKVTKKKVVAKKDDLIVCEEPTVPKKPVKKKLKKVKPPKNVIDMNEDITQELEEQLSQKEPQSNDELSFRLLDYNVFDSDDSLEDKKFMIRMFGINEKGETLCANVENFKPFFYVKIQDDWNSNVVNEWVYKDIKPGMGALYPQLEYEIVKHKQLYGFTGGKQFKFIKFQFDSVMAYNRLKNLWFQYVDVNTKEQSKDTSNEKKQVNEKGKNPAKKTDKKPDRIRKRINLVYKGYEIELYESNIPPLLRYFHVNKISPTGWIIMNKNQILIYGDEEKKSSCTIECTAPVEAIRADPIKETRVPYKICSFDIEASSSHGDFPLPRKTYKRLATNVVDVFIQQRKVNIDTVQAKKIFTKCILKAFSMNKYNEEIDVVYPKNMPTKAKVEELIDVITEKPLIDMLATTNPIVEQLMMTDNMFEQASQLAKSNEDADGGGGVVMDEPKQQHQHVEEGGSRFNLFKKRSKVKVAKKTLLLEFLLDVKYSRQENIDTLNELLSDKFPTLEGDKVTFIGSTFMNYGEKECHFQHCLVLGDCGKVDNCEIECAETEKDLLLQWTKLIQREDPDIIIGYNIFGFDYEFMFRRAQENNCASQFLQCSRIKDHISVRDQNHMNPGFDIMNTKIQIASGEYDLRYYNMLGRLQIDMYSYFRRDYNLSSYKLDDVAGQFISDSIKDLECDYDGENEVTKLYSSNLMGLNKGDYIHIEITSFTTDYYNNGEKFVVKHIEKGVEKDGKKYNVIVIAGHHALDQKKKLKWGMAKDDLSPQDIFRLANGSNEDKAIVAKYCIQDCNLVHHLMNKIDVITGYTEMSNICSVPVNFLIFRGQGIKLTSFVAKKCMDKNTLMPDLEKPKKEEGYEGAIVLPPKCSIYMDNPVACVDYSSLYPSSMISQNYSHDSKVWSMEYDLEGNLLEHKTQGVRNEKGEFIYDNLPDYEYIEIEFDTYEYLPKPGSTTGTKEKVKVGKKKCRWAQLPENQLSIMPSILTELLKARKDTRKQIKTESDPFMQNILDKRQLGYKVTANSLYGQCGARTSTFYEQDVAASTTATGRMMIIYAQLIIEKVYGNMLIDVPNYGTVRTKAEYVYGDTDSVFFTFNLETPEGEKIVGQKALELTIILAQEAGALSSEYLKPPMDLEYEKTFMPFILLSKKRYVGMLYEEDPHKGSMKYMGLSLKRRDSCDYLKDVYGGILTILMKENSIAAAISYLQESLMILADGKVSMDKLTITKALRSDYKNPHQIGHKVLADRIGMRDPGNKPKPGDRIKFVFVVNDKPGALMGEKIEIPSYIIENKVPIDFNHYITNQLMKPLQQLFGLAVKEIWTLQNKKSAIKTFDKDIQKLEKDCGGDLEVFMKKREKMTNVKVKALLFDKTLRLIYNRKHKIQTMDECFAKMGVNK
jgi:DNA polymerase elongation subunit (family B)